MAGSVILFVSSGIGFYGHGVILDPLRNIHGWSKGTVSSAITLYFFLNGFIGFITGRWVDRYGPKWFLVIGALIFGSGLWALKWIDAIPQLFLLYMVMSTGFCLTSLVPINMLITNWFIRKRGLAMSIANTGLSAGGVVLVPLMSYLIVHLGLDRALPIMGGIYMLGVIPMAVFLIKHRPSDIAQQPDGGDGNLRGRRQVLIADGQMRMWTRRQAAKTVAFWSIALAFMLALGGQIAYLVHQVSFLGQYLGPQKAAMAVSLTAMASIAGRLVLGLFVDRCDKRHVTMACILTQALAVMTLAFYDHVVLLYLCTFAFGLTMGSLIMMQSLLIGECFGIPSFTAVYGTIGLCSMPGAAFGPMLAGVIFDATQSYRLSFMLFAAASFLAVGIIYFAKPPPQPGKMDIPSTKSEILNNVE